MLLISDEEFEAKHGAQFASELARQKSFVENPVLLRKFVEENVRKEQQRWADTDALPEPRANMLAYQTTLARGFVKYPVRLKNWIVAKADPFSEVRRAWPVRLDVEPASKCNFRCIMCQVADWPNGKRAEDMTVEQLEQLLADQDTLTEVKLQGFGEPLMNKKLFDLLERLVAKDIWVRTTTNGSLLHLRDAYKRLVDSGAGDITASFDGADKETFEKIRVKSKFEDVVRGFTLLNEYANAKDILATRMWVVVQKANRDQFREFVELADKMHFRRLTFSLGLSDWGQDKWRETNAKLQANSFEQEEIEEIFARCKRYGIEVTFWNLAAKFSYKKGQICHWPFSWSYVGSDSQVTACCMIGDPRIIGLGGPEKFSDVWNSPRYRAFRNAHLTGNIPGACKNCYED
jgi:MoaA/NifB/PqqE/SkfB family radical SAM enzyme